MEKSRYRKCVICGIRKLPKSDILLASFPLNPDRCRLWVKASGIEDLIHIPIEKLHQLKYVCGSHFARECFNAKGTRLLSTAVPTLGLNRPFLSDDLFIEFPLHVKSYYKIENKSGEIARKKWKSLRDNYMRYKKEIAGSSGQAAKKFEKLPRVSHLQFLDVTLTERERTSNVTRNSTRTEISPETPPDTSASTAMTSTSITNELQSEQDCSPTCPEESISVHPRAKKQKKDSGDIDKTIDFIQKKNTDYDATDNLFKSYAQIFKKLSLKNQVFVKLELAKLFAEIELKDAEEKC